MLMDDRWYAIHVRPRFERTVTKLLAEKGYETFLPLRRSPRRWSDRVKQLDVPLFPHYVFCRVTRTATAPIVGTIGVIRIVGGGATPLPVDDDEIGALKRITAANLDAEPWRHLVMGQRVRVDRGPLAGVIGTLCRHGNGNRFVVSVTLLQRAIAVELDREAVVPAVDVDDGPIRSHGLPMAPARQGGAFSTQGFTP